MKFIKNKLFALTLAFALFLSACGTPGYDDTSSKTYTYDEAVTELESKLKKVTRTTIEPRLDLSGDDAVSKALADISTFEITVQGNGAINIEIATPSELSGDAPDDLINVIARKFNNERFQVNGKTISVTIRKISSGELVTYMTEGDYRPDAAIPSSYASGEMLAAKGIGVIKLTDRIAGNTAGVLMKREVYDSFIAKYGEVTLDKIIEASLSGDIIFGTTNPYTSATGLNNAAATLQSFDRDNPLSDVAVQKFIEYQQIAPSAAYTTGILRDKAAKGIIDAMAMEEQAFINTPELKNNYVFTPAGIRHDHPVYTFDYVSSERQEVVKKFVEYCLSSDSQRLADERGFNLHDNYRDQNPRLSGADYLAIQRIWKTNKDGGKPIIAVFVADISGSMDGVPLNSLKESLVAAAPYISSDNYVGLVSYSNDVYINLDIKQFDETQRAYFSGAVKSLTAGGGTATYDAVLVALDMLRAKAKEVPEAKLMLFVLSDGASNGGYSLSGITNIVGGMKVPIYTIGYNLRETSELQRLSEINEATLINADNDDIVNHLRNLFNVQL